MIEPKLHNWLSENKHLPYFLKDFHDQKTIFKFIHRLYLMDEGSFQPPPCTDCHIYTIDWFLWFMASRGYTLQKNRSKQNFKSIPKHLELPDKEKG